MNLNSACGAAGLYGVRNVQRVGKVEVCRPVKTAVRVEFMLLERLTRRHFEVVLIIEVQQQAVLLTVIYLARNVDGERQIAAYMAWPHCPFK